MFLIIFGERLKGIRPCGRNSQRLCILWWEGHWHDGGEVPPATLSNKPYAVYPIPTDEYLIILWQFFGWNIWRDVKHLPIFFCYSEQHQLIKVLLLNQNQSLITKKWLWRQKCSTVRVNKWMERKHVKQLYWLTGWTKEHQHIWFTRRSYTTPVGAAHHHSDPFTNKEVDEMFREVPINKKCNFHYTKFKHCTKNRSSISGLLSASQLLPFPHPTSFPCGGHHKQSRCSTVDTADVLKVTSPSTRLRFKPITRLRHYHTFILSTKSYYCILYIIWFQD